jgi:hypothetical protein
MPEREGLTLLDLHAGETEKGVAQGLAFLICDALEKAQTRPLDDTHL